MPVLNSFVFLLAVETSLMLALIIVRKARKARDLPVSQTKYFPISAKK